jgi:sugar lactone lactonase YvrE
MKSRSNGKSRFMGQPFSRNVRHKSLEQNWQNAVRQNMDAMNFRTDARKNMKTSIPRASLVAVAMSLMAGSAGGQNLFVSFIGPGNGEICEITPKGIASTFTNTVDQPRGLAVNSAGNLYAGSYYGGVYDFTANGTQNSFASPGGIIYGEAFDSLGDLFVSDYHDGDVFEIFPSGAVNTFASGLQGPEGLAFDSRGDLYVACHSGGDIIEFAGGTESTFASGLSLPAGLAFDGSGNLFVSCQTGDDIIEISTNGTKSTFASGLDDPNGIAFDNMGNLYVAETGGYDIVKYTPTGFPSLFAFGFGTDEPSGVAFEPVPYLRAAATNGTFQITVTMPSPYYPTILQSSTNMVSWRAIYTNTPPFIFTNPAADSPQSFYRAMVDTNVF